MVTVVGRATQTTLASAAVTGATNIKVVANANPKAVATRDRRHRGTQGLVKVASVSGTGASGTSVDLTRRSG
jgi:hypothetical protein